MTKPKLEKNISIKDFKNYYWLKTELIDFCKVLGIPRNGGKLELFNRIVSFLETGKTPVAEPIELKKTISTFDWNTEKLSISTLITDNYKNTENVRAFFIKNIGAKFKFNVAFMNWMKENKGKTLGDAIDKWQEINILKKDKNYKTEIAPQFEYNAYMRAFLQDNPNLSAKDAMKSWMIKRDKLGPKIYEKEDVMFLNCE